MHSNVTAQSGECLAMTANSLHWQVALQQELVTHFVNELEQLADSDTYMFSHLVKLIKVPGKT